MYSNGERKIAHDSHGEKTEFSKSFSLLTSGYSDLAGCSHRIKLSRMPKHLLIHFI